MDSGSTHYFITTYMLVGIANGVHVPCDVINRAVMDRIGDKQFSIDFFAIPVGGYEVVLGCHRLHNLGYIL